MRVPASVLLAVLTVSLSASAQTDRSLIAHYPLDEGRGTIARDKGAGEYEGRIRRAAWAPTSTGQALEFGRPPGHVDCGPASRLNLKDALTVCVWICPSGRPSGEPVIAGEGPMQWGITYYKNRKAYFYISSGGNSVSAPVQAYRWAHVAGSYDGKTMRLYLDGELKGERELPQGTPIKSSGNMFIGGGAREGDVYLGFLSDVRVYNAALTAAQVRAIAATPPGALQMPAASEQERLASTRFFAGLPEPLAFEAAGKTLRLANREVGIQFVRRRAGLSLSRIYGIKPAEDFISSNPLAHGGGFWRAEFRRERGRGARATLSSLSPATVTHDVQRTKTTLTLRLMWRGLSLPGEPGAVDVEVLVTLKELDPFSRWRVNVFNRSKTSGLWKVLCPALPLKPIGGDPEANVLAAAMYRGRLVQAPFLKDLGSYHRAENPGGYNMQFQALYDRSGKGLFLGTRDGGGFRKEYWWTAHPAVPFIAYGVAHFPPNMGYPNENFRVPYDVCIGPFSGDWYDACRIYREWALEQRWGAKGPLATRQDVPRWYKEAPATLVANSAWGDGDVGVVRRNAVAMIRYLDAELPLCWYTWKKHVPGKSHYNAPESPWRVPDGREYPCSNIHDGNYPLLPALGSFADACKAIREAGGYVKPYVCARIFDPGLNENAPLAEPARANRVRDADGRFRAGENRAKIAWRICPQTPWWQQRMAETARALVRREHAGGVYFDTFAGGVITCFDTRHGHRHGGANDPYLGARQLATALRGAMKQADPAAVMSGESPSETAIDLLDGFLYAYTITPQTVPMFASVYGDYIVRYGMTLDPRSEMFYTQCATLFTEGAQMGRLSVAASQEVMGHLKDCEAGCPYAEKMNFMRTLARYWKPGAGAQFLAYGRLLRPLSFTESHLMPVVSYPAGRSLQREGHENLVVDALQSGVFLAPDGRIGVFLVNVTEQPVDFRFELAPDRYPMSREKRHSVTRVGPDGDVFRRTGPRHGKVECSGQVPGRGVAFFRITSH